jgi:hypothetical protein
MSDGIYKPNPGLKPMRPLPDKVTARDGTVFNPNAPAPRREPVQDRRPSVLYNGPEFTAEYWDRRLAEREAQRNGHK